MANEEVLINTPEGIAAYMQGGLTFRQPGITVIRNSKGAAQMAVVGEGIVRSGSDAGDEQKISVSENGDQYVAQGLPPYTELTRKYGGWSAISIVAVAALGVRPSTVSLFTLWNGEAAGSGKSYVIDRLFTHQLVSGSAQSRFGMWAVIHPRGMTDPGEDLAASISNVTGNAGKKYDGQAKVGVGETVLNDGWYPWGPSVDVELTGTLPGAQMSVDVEGRLIVPPQGGISLHVVASSTNEDFTIGCSWYEIPLKLAEF